MNPLFNHVDSILFGSYDADAPTIQCSVCLTDYDAEDVGAGEVYMHEVAGEKVCSDCIERCEGCGDVLSDEFAHLGPETRIRQWAFDGRLGTFHAECAADDLLASWAGRPMLSADHLNRFQIGAIVHEAFPKAVTQ